MQVLVYQRTGVDAIDAARRRIYDLLNRQVVIPVVDGGCWEIVHAGAQASEGLIGCDP